MMSRPALPTSGTLFAKRLDPNEPAYNFDSVVSWVILALIPATTGQMSADDAEPEEETR